MKILGIETSCDETAAAVVKNPPAGEAGGTEILSNIVASSAEMHVKTGGIIPEQAARQQVVSIMPVINSALAKASCAPREIDAIAITYGPGLIGSLLVGVETAKTLSLIWKKPIIPINHLVAHIYANFVCEKSKIKSQKSKLPQFPLIALVVSGGHTDLVMMKGHGEVKWLGGTRDDAAGEAFDKCARILGLGYPGGPAIAAEAAKFETQNPKSELKLFPRPLINSPDFDFSFSGLKTSVLRKAQKLAPKLKPQIPRLAAEIQEAIADVLVQKTLRAVQKYRPKSVVLAGGVAANKHLREKFELEIRNSKLEINFFVPLPKLCTDNAACIASCAYFNYSPVPWHKISANPQLTISD
jgi:N6-L-threonylcarbamoyladenine synthase